MAALPDSRGSVSVPSRARQQSASLLIVVLGLAVSSIPARSASVRLTFESPPVKVFLDEKAPAGSPAARLLLVRGEHRSLQLLITAGERKLESVTVRSSFAAGARLSAEVGLVGYVRTSPKDGRPWDKTEQTAEIGWWPDPLLPNRPFDVLPGETQPVWITVFAPPGTRASNYKTGLTVVLAPGQKHELSYTVRVVDVDLAAAQTFRNAAFMPAGNLSAHYRPKGDLAGAEFLALYERWLRKAFSQHLGPTFDMLMMRQFAIALLDREQTWEQHTEAMEIDLAGISSSSRASIPILTNPPG